MPSEVQKGARARIHSGVCGHDHGDLKGRIVLVALAIGPKTCLVTLLDPPPDGIGALIELDYGCLEPDTVATER